MRKSRENLNNLSSRVTSSIGNSIDRGVNSSFNFLSFLDQKLKSFLTRYPTFLAILALGSLATFILVNFIL